MALKGWFRFDDQVGGIPDGTNTLFETKEPYKPGTLNAILNGQVKAANRDDGFVELGNKQFRMKQPPLSDDTVGACYVVWE